MISHTYVIYSFAGSALGLLLVVALFKIGLIKNHHQRARLIFLPLILPIFIYGIYHFILKKPCTVDFLAFTYGDVRSWYTAICSFGYWMAEILVPFFVVTAIYALIKAIISIWYSKRLIARYGKTNKKEYFAAYTKLTELSNKFKIDTPNLIVIPHLRPKAFTFGIKKPIIAVSTGMLKFLSQEELEMVLAHELSHILRRDIVSNWLSVLLRDLMFFNPLVHWCFNMYQNEKEQAADMYALEKINNPVGYASLLLKLWKAQKSFTMSDFLVDNLSPYPSFFGRSNILESRIRMALNYKSQNESKTRPLFWIVLISIVTAWALALIC